MVKHGDSRITTMEPPLLLRAPTHLRHMMEAVLGQSVVRVWMSRVWPLWVALVHAVVLWGTAAGHERGAWVHQLHDVDIMELARDDQAWEHFQRNALTPQERAFRVDSVRMTFWTVLLVFGSAVIALMLAFFGVLVWAGWSCAVPLMRVMHTMVSMWGWWGVVGSAVGLVVAARVYARST
jgi:hypothetical protein